MSPKTPLLASFVLCIACTPLGTDGGGGGGGGGGGVGDFDDPECYQVEEIAATASADPADLLLVVDKSGSMDETLGSGDNKWNTMRGALNSVVTQYDDGINFGLSLFPVGDDCNPGTVIAPIAERNATAISGAVSSVNPDGPTPTHTTLQAARTYFDGIADNPNGRYVLLATDGEPNCGDPNDTQVPTVTESIAAITALEQAGIPTFVLGFGGTVNNEPQTLQQMAQAGGTMDYYAANNPAQLATALDAIAAELGVISCTFRVDGVVDNPDALTLSQDGVEIPRDPSGNEGWDFDPVTNSITLFGSACDALKDGGVTQVEIGLGCGYDDETCSNTCEVDADCAGDEPMCNDGCCVVIID